MAGILSRGLAALKRFLQKEFAAGWPVFLFFLVGFLLLISLIKLALAGFSIQLTVIPKAVLGALIAAKAALVLDETPLARSLDRYPRIVAVGVKTVFYGTASLLLGFLEHFLDVFRKVHGLHATVRYFIAHSNPYRPVAWALGISIVFALYFSFFEIGRRMGEGELRKLFFEFPANAGKSECRSNAHERQSRN